MESGRLEHESSASVCRRLAAESRTGCLHLTAGDDRTPLEARMYLREGRVYTASAPGSAARLGDRLVEGGILTAEELQHALDIHRGRPDGTRLGEVLVTSGIVPREALRSVVRDQVVDAIAVPLSWTVGGWQFAEGEAVPEDMPLGLGMQDMLMEASRRLGASGTAAAHLASLDTVVDFAAGGTEARLSLKADEWSLLTHVDGINSVADIAERLGCPPERAAIIVHGLLSAGVVARAGEEAVPAPAPSVAAHGEAVPVESDPEPAAEAQEEPPPPAADPLEQLDQLEGFARGGAPRPAAVRPASPTGPTTAPPGPFQPAWSTQAGQRGDEEADAATSGRSTPRRRGLRNPFKRD